MSSLGKTTAALRLIRRSTSTTTSLLPNGIGRGGVEAGTAAALPHAGEGVAKEIEKSIASGALQRRQQQQQQEQSKLKQQEPTFPSR